MKIKNLFLALLALPLFFVACDENKAVDEVKNPTVKVTAGTVTETTLSFTIESTDAAKVAYLVVEGTDVPTASEVLANGKEVAANKSVTATEEGLKASTSYVVVAAVQNSKAAEKDFIQMTTNAAVTPGPGTGEEPGGEEPGGDEPGTGDEPGDETDKVEFVATHIVTDYTNDDGIHLYVFELGNNTWNSNGWCVDGGTYYSFGIISASKGNGVLPNGTYSLASSYSANTIADDYAYRYQMENGDMVNGFEMYKDANLVITNGKIEANIEMLNGEIHHVVFEGSLVVGDGGTQVPTEFEATHTADKWYWGGSSNYGNKYMVSGEGFSVDVHFPSQYAAETTLQTGLYTWTSTSWWGYNDFVEFTTRSFVADGVSVAVDAGTAVVEAEGDVYHIEITLQGRDGFVYMIEYNGKLNDKGEVGGGDESGAIVLTNFEYSSYNSYYYFYEYKLSNDEGDKMTLRVNDYTANESTILPGSYVWASASMCGNQGLFSTNNVYVGGVKYDVSSGTMEVADKSTLDLTITLNLANGDVVVFTYAEAGGNEGGSTEPAEPVKLATPSVFGNVEGNSVVISWQEIAGAKDYTVTLEGVETKTVTNAYISYANLAWNTTYNVSVVANSSNEALYITSEAGTASFTTGAQPEDGGNEGGNTDSPVASYENWVFSASLDMGAKLVTCTDGSHTLTFTLSEIAGATFSINDGSLRAYNVTVNGVATEDASGTLEMSSASGYCIVLNAYINGVHYTGTSTNPVV